MKIIKKNKELKIGDVVRVKSYEEIEKTFHSIHMGTANGCNFLSDMIKYCSCEFEIKNIYELSGNVKRYGLKTTCYWFDKSWLDL